MTSFISPQAKIGEGTHIEGFASIGSRAEHKEHWHKDSEFNVVIGKDCVIREFVTINAGTKRVTSVGDCVCLLRNSHIGHDANVRDHAIISCNAIVAGHVNIGEGANLGLGTITRQYVNVGAYAMVGMGSVVTKDIPPFRKWFGNPAKDHGINEVGIVRAGLDLDSINMWFLQCGPSYDRNLSVLKERERNLVLDWLKDRGKV
jgi:UDP-N-acetylglucosamine acyltransferase